MCEERGCNGSPAPVHHSTMALCSYVGLGFLNEHSQLWNSSLLSPQAISSQPTTVPPPGLLSTPTLFQPPAPMCTGKYISGLGTQGCGKDYLCRSHSVLPATGQLLHSPPIAPKTPLLSQNISLLVRGLT